MYRLYQYVCRSELLLVMTLLSSCGTPSLRSANIPLSPPTNTSYPGPTIQNPAPYPVSQLPSGEAQPQVSAPTSAGLASSPAPVLGVVVDSHMQVLSVEVSSAAETAGIQAGDYLESIDGIRLDSHMQTVKERIYTAQKDQPMRLTLRRGEMVMDVIVVPFSSSVRSGSRAEPGHLMSTATPVVPPDDYL
jgi:S1-C subfamily serine protease